MALNHYDEEYQDLAFDRHDPPPEGPRTAFRDCRFVGCDMTGMNMKNSLFSSCEFVRCNLSLLQVDGARFLEAAFQDCKLAGVNFALCDDFLLRLAFEECRLQQCSFAMLSMPGTGFRRCDIQACDFVQADLTGADFSGSRLTGSSGRHGAPGRPRHPPGVGGGPHHPAGPWGSIPNIRQSKPMPPMRHI